MVKMIENNILVDSSFLYALYDYRNKDYGDAIAVADLYQQSFIIPYIVLTEVAYLFRRKGGIPAVATFLDALLQGDYRYEVVAPQDIGRAREIMLHYSEAKFDFVDCCIMALSERLNISQVCTLDHRDFMIFRPKHIDVLEILP
jgi:uncharacterized protein